MMEPMKRPASDLERVQAPSRAAAPDGPAGRAGRFTSGAPSLDGYTGGLGRGRLHEVLPTGGAVAATGFALGLALRASGAGPIGWVRHDALDHEVGQPSGAGLAALGEGPERVLVVPLRRAEDVLRAALEAARCPGLGAVLLQVRDEPRRLDLTATRRLALAAAASGVTVILERAGEGPSAAVTRWGVSAAASTPLEAGAPGHPAFLVTLLRHRGGLTGRAWRLEWSRDRQSFADGIADGASLPGAVVPAPAHRPAASGLAPGVVPGRDREGRRAG